MARCRVEAVNWLKWLAGEVILEFTIYGTSMNSLHVNVHIYPPIWSESFASYLCHFFCVQVLDEWLLLDVQDQQ